MEAYKVVRVVDKDLYKSTTNFCCIALFKKGKRTKPSKGCGPFACFNTIENAVRFLRKADWVCLDKSLAIVKVTGRQSKHKGLWYTHLITGIRQYNIGVYQHIEEDTNKIVIDFPQGTIFMTDLTVISEVPNVY